VEDAGPLYLALFARTRLLGRLLLYTAAVHACPRDNGRANVLLLRIQENPLDGQIFSALRSTNKIVSNIHSCLAKLIQNYFPSFYPPQWEFLATGNWRDNHPEP